MNRHNFSRFILAVYDTYSNSLALSWTICWVIIWICCVFFDALQEPWISCPTWPACQWQFGQHSMSAGSLFFAQKMLPSHKLPPPRWPEMLIDAVRFSPVFVSCLWWILVPTTCSKMRANHKSSAISHPVITPLLHQGTPQPRDRMDRNPPELPPLSSCRVLLGDGTQFYVWFFWSNSQTLGVFLGTGFLMFYCNLIFFILLPVC